MRRCAAQRAAYFGACVNAIFELVELHSVRLVLEVVYQHEKQAVAPALKYISPHGNTAVASGFKWARAFACVRAQHIVGSSSTVSARASAPAIVCVSAWGEGSGLWSGLGLPPLSLFLSSRFVDH